MLKHLSIRDVLLIERVELEFSGGLNVLTGETGAGKSILLDALGFVLGWRGRAELVRHGAETGEVTARFELAAGHPALHVLDDAGIPYESDLILRRINSRDGRKRAFVNDRACSGEVLRALSDVLVEIHGQHDDRGLLNPKGHRALLDSFAGVERELATTRVAWRDLRAARQALKSAREELEIAAQDADFMRHALDEIDALNPAFGEDEKLDAQRRLMQGAERIREDIAKALHVIGMDGAEGGLIDAMRWLGDVDEAADGQLGEPVEALGRSMLELAEAQSGVEAVLQRLDFDPFELEQVEERLFAIRAMARKHNIQPDTLPELAADFRGKLKKIDLGDAHLRALEADLQMAETGYHKAADALSIMRRKAAKRLDKAMGEELTPLKMERAAFITEIGVAADGPDGVDSVLFSVATNPGAPAGPINKIASGGELSRFLLALKVCLTTRAQGLTLIFDEIDRGVGGATADAVGRRLAAVAQDAQVLVVTHSPQVAALGAQHFLVSKAVQDAQTRTSVEALTGFERRDEIARMLAGEVITDAARSAADALLG